MKNYSAMDGEIIEMDVVPASQKMKKNYFDDDNFYPFDSSNEFGDEFFTKETGVDHSEFLGIGSGKVKALFNRDRSQDGQSKTKRTRSGRLSGLLQGIRDNKQTRVDNRAKRQLNREKRRDSRMKRRLQLLDARTKLNLSKILQTAPTGVKQAFDSAQRELISDHETKIVSDVIDMAQQGAQTFGEVAENIGVDFSMPSTTPQEPFIEPVKEEKFWKSLSTGAKVGIIGGSALLATLIVVAIVKSSKK